MPTYEIRLEDGRKVELNTPRRVSPEHWQHEKNLPDWTLLTYYQCNNCPLSEERITYCPAAAALSELIDNFATVVSFEKVELIITRPNGQFSLHGSAQMVVFALLVEFVTRAKCPYLFDPSSDKGFYFLCMDVEQLLFRFFSGFLIQHHLLSSGEPDPHAVNWNRFQQFMGEIRVALEGLLERIQAQCREDANINALTGAISISKLLEEHWDDSLRLFKDMTFN
ncbi:MAG: hypothetical protein AAFX93_02565 [Verrucomicrobiota bacterium]